MKVATIEIHCDQLDPDCKAISYSVEMMRVFYTITRPNGEVIAHVDPMHFTEAAVVGALVEGIADALGAPTAQMRSERHKE